MRLPRGSPATFISRPLPRPPPPSISTGRHQTEDGKIKGRPSFGHRSLDRLGFPTRTPLLSPPAETPTASGFRAPAGLPRASERPLRGPASLKLPCRVVGPSRGLSGSGMGGYGTKSTALSLSIPHSAGAAAARQAVRRLSNVAKSLSLARAPAPESDPELPLKLKNSRTDPGFGPDGDLHGRSPGRVDRLRIRDFGRDA